MIVKNLQEFHKEVCSREDYVCRVCNKDFNHPMYINENGVNQWVCGHHYPHTQKARPDLVLETDNGVCICSNCHLKAHKGLVSIPEKTDKSPESFIPEGVRIPSQALCKCGRYLILDSIGICLACEKRLPPNFKTPKKAKK